MIGHEEFFDGEAGVQLYGGGSTSSLNFLISLYFFLLTSAT